jgi:UPF0042 nucleotide-binding protein
MSKSSRAHVIIVSGLSGSGKSVAIRALEDSGWHCVDNLPINSMKAVVESLRDSGIERIALGIDARHRGNLNEIFEVIEDFRRASIEVRQIFLDAQPFELMRRFAEARRPHPLSQEGLGLADCIDEEKRRLSLLAENSQRIDTSHLRPNALRAEIKAYALASPDRLSLFLFSFGFKIGIPQESDFVFDVRYLPNPYYDPLLRPLTGLDQPVIDFLKDLPEAGETVDDISALLERWIPRFERDHRHVLSIAIGCTGGQHRSVYITEELRKRLGPKYPTFVVHRSLT